MRDTLITRAEHPGSQQEGAMHASFDRKKRAAGRNVSTNLRAVHSGAFQSLGHLRPKPLSPNDKGNHFQEDGGKPTSQGIFSPLSSGPIGDPRSAVSLSGRVARGRFELPAQGLRGSWSFGQEIVPCSISPRSELPVPTAKALVPSFLSQ